MIKLSDFVFKYLLEYGIKDVFMLSGGGCMHLCDSLGRSGLNYVCCLHEQAASIAALSYAQYNNDLGVALVTTGPGGTNAITGVSGAWVESVPLLIISGQVKISDIAGDSGVRMLGFQELPVADIVKPITKYAVTVTDPKEILFHLEKAIYIAKTGRPGPVWIDIPLDIQALQIDEKDLLRFTPPARIKENTSPTTYKKVIEMINTSKRPVIMAGYGIRAGNAVSEFSELVDRLGIPVLTTWKGADLISFDNPYFFGRPGTAGQRAANFIQQNADLIISIGARLDFGQIGYEHSLFAREAIKIVVDVDSSELKKFKFKVDLPVCLDAKEFLNGMLSLDLVKKDCSDWIMHCKDWNERYPVVVTKEYMNKADYVSSYALAKVISDNMRHDDLFVPGSSGMCADIPMQVFNFKKGQRSINSPGLGSMGYGVPSAIGACIASGKKRTICTNGDGGFQLNIQELETIKRLNLPIKFFVINNDGYGSIKTTQRNYFEGFYVGTNPKSGVTLPQLTKIADAYGFSAFVISKSEMIKDIVVKVLECKGPVICEVIVDPVETIVFKASSYVNKEGKNVSKPLEDLYPFLPREEFYQNMIIEPIKE